MSETVLDSSAILAAILGEPGGDKVGKLTGPILVSAVNYAEVGGRLSDLGFERDFLRETPAMLGFEVVPFDAELASVAADLRPSTRRHGLSLGDRACLALAASRGAVALTADRVWKEMDLPVEIELVR